MRISDWSSDVCSSDLVESMTFVVIDNCIKCKYTDCVEVCPVDAFHEGPNFLVIDPDECIDCTLCEPECPINAIYPEDDVPEIRRASCRDRAVRVNRAGRRIITNKQTRKVRIKI